MAEIIFKAAFGNEEKIVELSTPNGAGGVYYFIIDNFYQGKVHEMMHGYRVSLQNPDPDYTQADFDILIDIVLEHEQGVL
ncbi:hypothetical protein ACTJKN_05220 [Pedobacter sp. 22163]|uniref:hypothetical protein n=1 Tax=Pedobacter sp. 22163 TaxID=3453883 RepID=UPI003F82B49E